MPRQDWSEKYRILLIDSFKSVLIASFDGHGREKVNSATQSGRVGPGQNPAHIMRTVSTCA